MEESELVEVKSSLSDMKSIIETLSAFSNSKGGRLHVGIDDKLRILGVSIGKNTLENLSNNIVRNTDPPLYPTLHVEEIEGKMTIIIEVKESPIKPVFAYDRAFKRVGRTNQRLKSIEIREMSRIGVGYCFTAQNPKGATLDDINDETIRTFVETSKEKRGWEVKYSDKRDFLVKMGLIHESDITIAAVLLFGINPQQHIIQSEVKCGRFKGSMPLEFEDFDVIGGDLFSQVDGLMRSIKRNLKLEVKIADKLERVERWEYPLDAIREGIVNAICHRDYGKTSNVQVRIFDDRFEIWSPGKLPPGITVEKLKGQHESAPPNPLIAKPFFLVGLIENWGTGTNRIMEDCKNAGMPEPEFVDTGTSFIITFRKDLINEKYLRDLGLNERQVKATLYTKEHGKITNNVYQNICEVSKRQASDDLNGLEKLEILVRIGKTGKGTYYVLKGHQRGERGIEGVSKGHQHVVKDEKDSHTSQGPERDGAE